MFEHLESWDFDVEEMLERSEEAAEQRLEDELERVKNQLEERESVHQDIVDELEGKLEWYQDRLESLYTIGTGKRDGTRERLKYRIERFYALIRDEKREFWRDRQDLERERREVMRELEELDEVSIAELL